MYDPPDQPLALRPLAEFGPRRRSVFEDPADERSWHVSQRFEGLSSFYEGREPSWYASAVRPLMNRRRVLELGAGPGLALQALRDAGVGSVIGIDRWPGFARRGRSVGVPILLHDLTLPFPFIRTASVDGVLSHYVMDYMSPIAVRQTLREARRVLEPGGEILIYLAAIGLAGGDPARTVPYTPELMAALLAEAGFEQIATEPSSNGRNTVARASAGSDPAPGVSTSSSSPSAEAHGELQLSAGFTASDAPPSPIEVELHSDEGATVLRLDPGAPRGSIELPLAELAVSARLVGVSPSAWELQTCLWAGGDLVSSKAVRVEGAVRRLSVGSGGVPEHVSIWRPTDLAAEPGACPYRRSQPDSTEHSRAIVVRDDSANESSLTVINVRRRFSPDVTVPDLDAEWQAGLLDGAAVVPGEAETRGTATALMWARLRKALVVVEASSWEEGLRAASRLLTEGGCPILIVDPALGAGHVPDVASPFPDLPADADELHLVTAAGASADPGDTARPTLVDSGGRAASRNSGAEDLRYLLDRALLLRLRVKTRRSPADLGRRPPLGA